MSDKKGFPWDDKSPEIDLEYYMSLPIVPADENMVEFHTMFLLGGKLEDYDWNDVITLMSDPLSSPEEAEHFARAIERHCKGIVWVIDNVVKAKFHKYSVEANYRKEMCKFIFANWG